VRLRDRGSRRPGGGGCLRDGLSCGQHEGGGVGETVWLAGACSASTETWVTVTLADGLRECLPEKELNRLAVELREVVELDHVNPALA
jgi:hypothetical protein